MYQPLLDEMSLIKRLEWIAANESKLKPASNGSIMESLTRQTRKVQVK
jgi:hypothetical protein